jgi:soluble cytochrome b562
VGSPGYVSVHKSLRYDIDRLQKMALTNAQVAKQNSDRLQAALEQGKEAGEAVKRALQAEMERLEAKAAEERARAVEDAERKRVSHEQEMKELREKQLVVVRQQDDTQLQMWEGRFAAMQAQMQQLTSAISAYHITGAGRQPYINAVRVTGGYTVEEPDECGPARYRPRAQSCRRQCSGITRKGYRCSLNAQPGRSGCHHH